MPKINTSSEMPEKQQQKPEKKSYSIRWFTLFVLLLGIGWSLYWYFYLQFYRLTDDAYANGNNITLNPVISGSVIKFFGDNTDLVEEGQLLVLLDPTHYQIAYERELASLASTVLQVRQLYDAMEVNLANVEAQKVTLERAIYDFKNRSNLVNTGAVSDEDIVHADTSVKIAEANLKMAKYQLKSSKAAAGNTPIEQHPLIKQQKSNVRTAFYYLQHCSIYAPYKGHIAQRSVNVGEWVTPTTSLMAIIPTDYVWVDANFKETELTYMRIGQPARVWLDIYGSRVVYEGKVLGIASGTGSVFSIIPPQNATGNWIKIVQRLPVRISLDKEVVEKYPLRLGLSANVSVNITDQDLPLLAIAPSHEPIAKTNIFELQMEEVNDLIEAVVQENLSEPLPK